MYGAPFTGLANFNSAFVFICEFQLFYLICFFVSIDTCTVHPYFQKYISECNGAYKMSNLDKKWYKAGWQDPTEKSGKQKKRFSPWKYASGTESRNIIPVMATLNTYVGGGYLGELGVDEKFSLMYERYMKKYNWVDQHTRAVFLEFTLYNPNLNLISVGMLMFEFFNFGGVLPKAEIYVSRLYRNLVPVHKVLLAFDIIFFIYTLYTLFRECRKIKRTKGEYFKSLDNVTNLMLVFMGIGVMGTYAIRSLSLGTKIGEFNENPSLFISFYQNAMYHEMVAVLMSLIDFIAMIKFLTFLQFNRMFLILIQTIVRAAPRLIIFCIYISLWVFAFILFFFLLLGSERYNFSSIQRTTYSLNLLLLGVFDWADFEARPISGPLLFVVYIIIMTFMLMNIFMTILMEVYAVVQMDEELRKREFHLVQYLMESLMLSMGLKKPLGLGDEDEVRWRKKDPFIHRMNRIQRSIEDRKLKKMNKMINKLHADDLIEDVEMVSLELMSYPDEFYELIPCSIRVKLQTMLRRGEIDYKTYCEFLEISIMDQETASVASSDSQKTMNSVPDIEDTSSIALSITENNDTQILADPTEDTVNADKTEEEFLRRYQQETFSPRQIASISKLDLQFEGEGDGDDMEGKSDQGGFSLSQSTEEGFIQDATSNAQLISKRKKSKISPTKPPLSIRLKNSAEIIDLPSPNGDKSHGITETAPAHIPMSLEESFAQHERKSLESSINIEIGDITSTSTNASLDSARHLLDSSASNAHLVAASRRKKKKKNPAMTPSSEV